MRKKIREVLDLGEKIDDFAYPAEPSILWDPQYKRDTSFVKQIFLSNGLPLTCDSFTHSDIINCNTREVNRVLGKASEGLWNSMNKLGIANFSNAFDPILKLEEMEKRDCKDKNVIKGINIQL